MFANYQAIENSIQISLGKCRKRQGKLEITSYWLYSPYVNLSQCATSAVNRSIIFLYRDKWFYFQFHFSLFVMQIHMYRSIWCGESLNKTPRLFSPANGSCWTLQEKSVRRLQTRVLYPVQYEKFLTRQFTLFGFPFFNFHQRRKSNDAEMHLIPDAKDIIGPLIEQQYVIKRKYFENAKGIFPIGR